MTTLTIEIRGNRIPQLTYRSVLTSDDERRGPVTTITGPSSAFDFRASTGGDIVRVLDADAVTATTHFCETF